IKRGAQVSVLHSAADELLITLANARTVAPSGLPRALAEIVVAAAALAGRQAPAALGGIEASDSAKAMAVSLAGAAAAAIGRTQGAGKAAKGIFLGNFAQQ